MKSGRSSEKGNQDGTWQAGEELAYQDRLKEIGLTTLMQRRVGGDTIELYRLLHGFDKVDYRKFVKLCSVAYR